MKKWLENSFGIDYRSLAFFRISLAILVIYDVIMRLCDINAFYTDHGLLSRADNILTAHPLRFSIYNASGSTLWVAILLFVNLFFAVKMLYGKNTFWSTAICWFLNLNIQNRNWFILNAGDTLIRMLLFWGMFLPMGARWAVDSIKENIKEKTYLSASGLVAMLQLCLMYWFTAYLKNGDEWLKDYTAIYYALQIDLFATQFGLWVGQFYEFLKPLTRFTLWLEFVGPLIAFTPIFTVPVRYVLIVCFIGLHLSIIAMLKVGIFSTVSLIGWSLFIPGHFWDWFEKTKLFIFISNLSFSSAVVFDYFRDWGVPTFKYKNILAIFLFIFVYYFNLTTIENSRWSRPKWVMDFSQILRLDQKWEMFAPFPMKDDGWFVMPGKLENGKEVNVFTFKEEVVDFKKPYDVSSYMSNMRWRKQILNLRKEENSKHRMFYAKWVCRKWNKGKKFGERLEHFDIYFMGEWTLDKYQVNTKKFHLWSHNCLI